MDVDDLTPLLKRMVDLIRPRADDLPDAVTHCKHKRNRKRNRNRAPILQTADDSSRICLCCAVLGCAVLACS